MEKNLLFVYGTLKSGFNNNYLLRTSKKQEGEYALLGYKMYSMGGFPAIVATGEMSDFVIGEVWEVDPDMEKSIDRLEGYDDKDHHWYDKVESSFCFPAYVKKDEGEGSIKYDYVPFARKNVFVYTMEEHQVKNREIVESGIWK